jgi:TonB family protein
MIRRRSLSVALLLALSACAKHVPPPKTAAPPPKVEEPPPAAHPPPRRDPEDEMVLKGDVLGTLADEDIAQAFRGRWGEVTRCLRESPPKLAYLIGKVELKMRVTTDGAPKQAHVQDSSLGHYAAEQCLLELAQTLKFPAPRGGAEAEFSYPIEFKPARTAAAVTDWSKDRIAPEQLAANMKVLMHCRASTDGKALPPPPPPHKGKAKHPHHAHATPLPNGPMRALPKNLRLTLYIAPGGKVVTAGLSADGPIDPPMGQCFVGGASLWRLDDPGGRPAKVTVEVP